MKSLHILYKSVTWPQRPHFGSETPADETLDRRGTSPSTDGKTSLLMAETSVATRAVLPLWHNRPDMRRTARVREPDLSVSFGSGGALGEIAGGGAGRAGHAFLE